MNIETGAPCNRSGEMRRSGRHAEAQLSLPLEVDSLNDEVALRAAWMRCGLRLPYHVALQTRPIAICLNCLADAMRKKACKDRYGAMATAAPGGGANSITLDPIVSNSGI